jgi:phospholipid transport system substrate-binding protein
MQKVRAFILLFLLCPLFVVGSGIPASKAESAEAFIEKVNRASNQLLDAPSAAGCHSLLRWAFDVPAMGRYALGDAWNKVTVAQRNTYLAAFENVIVSAYLRRMKAYRGAKMTFAGVRGSGSTRTAASNLKGGNVDQTWIWRMRISGSSWRITDVVIDGRSALYAEKQEYAEILEANKGDLNAVIAYIKRRT